ncbi:MAG: hypothetical protein K6F72_00105 [Bacteroidales bacterium]|nr:hypothetical protein [Bacteroidales bacterium]
MDDLHINRDLLVGRNVIMGGNQIVRGNMQVDQGMVVKGWLKAENINFPTVGIYTSLEALNEAYPAPQKPGYIAGVLDLSGDTAKAILYWNQAGETPWVTTDPPTYIEIRTILNVTAEGISADTVRVLQQDINDLDGNKADKLPMSGGGAATENNFMAINSSGNIKDSGYKPGDFVTKVESAVNGNFAGLNDSGEVVDSGYSPSSFASTNHTHSGKADKVEGATAYNLAMLDENGNLMDSQKSVALLDQLGIQTGYFNRFLGSGETIDTEERLKDIKPADYATLIFYDATNARFLCRNNETNKYHTMWNDNGEAAYMDGSKIRKNKLYVNGRGDIFFSDSHDALVQLNDISGKADKDDDAVQGNIAVFDAYGNPVDSNRSVDNAPTDSSTNLVTSGGVYTALGAKETTSNKVTSFNNPTDSQYPSALLTETCLLERMEKVNMIRFAGDTVAITVRVAAGKYDIMSSYIQAPWVYLAFLIVDDHDLYMGEITNIYLTAGTHVLKYHFKNYKIIPNSFFAAMNGSGSGVLTVETLYIPSYIRKIEERAFEDCNALGEITCEAVTPPLIESNTFHHISQNAILKRHHVARDEYANIQGTWGPWAEVFIVADDMQEDIV